MLILEQFRWAIWKQRSGAPRRPMQWEKLGNYIPQFLRKGRRDDISRRSSGHLSQGREWEMRWWGQPTSSGLYLHIHKPPTVVGCATQPPLSPLPVAVAGLGLSDGALR